MKARLPSPLEIIVRPSICLRLPVWTCGGSVEGAESVCLLKALLILLPRGSDEHSPHAPSILGHQDITLPAFYGLHRPRLLWHTPGEIGLAP